MGNLTPLYEEVDVRGLDQVVSDLADARMNKPGMSRFTLREIARLSGTKLYTLACIEHKILRTIHEFLDKEITDPAEPATRLGLRASTVDRFGRAYELYSSNEDKDLHADYSYE